MAKRTIEQIKIGKFPANTAFGANVYNFNIQLGANGDATTVEIDLINESGLYNISSKNLNGTSPFSIIVGGSKTTGFFIKSAFLVSYDYGEGTGQRILKLKFVDGSSILNKIQVLLLNKQASPYNSAVLGRGLWFHKEAGTQKAVNYTIPIHCQNACANTGLPPWSVTGPAVNPWNDFRKNVYGQYRTPSILKQPIAYPDTPLTPNLLGFRQPFGFPRGRGSAKPNYIHYADYCQWTNVNANDMARGGVIIVGEEDFVSSRCQLPSVSYTFNELIFVLENLIGIPCLRADNGASVLTRPIPGATNKRYDFNGDLKSVLNEWCALFGIGFNWDASTDRIFFHDLTKPVASIDEVYNIVSAIKEGHSGTTAAGPVAIESISHNVSIENTYNHDCVSTYTKPARTITSKTENTRKVLFKPITLDNIIPSNYYSNFSGGRTVSELLISAALSKYNPNARTLYNFYLMAVKSNNFTNVTGLDGRPLGLNLAHKLNAQEKADLLTFTMSPKDREANNKKYGSGSGVFLGTYSKEREQRWIDWERGIADFIGKYYYVTADFEDQFVCDKFRQMVFQQEVITNPRTELHALAPQSARRTHGPADVSKDLPFANILKHPEGAILGPLYSDLTGAPVNKFYLFERGPAWGTTDEQLDGLFYNAKGEEVLKDWLPTFAQIDGNTKLFMDTVIEKTMPEVWNKLEQIEDDDKKPQLLFFPDRDTLASIFKITNLFGTAGVDWVQAGNNPNLPAGGNYENTREYKPAAETDEAKECSLVCDLSLEDFLCQCPEGEQFDPDAIGLTNVYARHFNIFVKGSVNSQNKIILPSEYPYQGFVTVRQENRRTVPSIKQQFGTLSNARGAMSYRVDSPNITSDIDAANDVTKYGGPVAPGGEAGQILSQVMHPGAGSPMSAASYHRNISDTSHSVFRPTQTLNFTMVGLNTIPLVNAAGEGLLDVQKGLTSLNINFAEDGLRLNASYSNRPVTNPSRELFLQKIEPRLNAATFLRTY